MRRAAAAALAAAFILTGCAATDGEEKTPTPTPPWLITRVVDGDTAEARRTVVTDGGQTTREITIRVLGIDTPETYRSDECYGQQATQTAKQALADTRVWLKTDPTQGDIGVYDRKLRYIHDAQGHSYGMMMLKTGHARVADIYGEPPQRYEQYQQLQREAAQAGRGLWGACTGGQQTPTPIPTPTSTSSDEYPLDPDAADLDCADVGINIPVRPSDPHNLDGDGNGVGCES